MGGGGEGRGLGTKPHQPQPQLQLCPPFSFSFPLTSSPNHDPACVMWPPKPAAGVGVGISSSATAVAAATVSSSTMPWNLTAVSVNGSNQQLSTSDGSIAGPDLARRAAAIGALGGSLAFSWGGNLVEIVSRASGVFVALNGGNEQRVSNPADMHLDLSRMACCIGDGEWNG